MRDRESGTPWRQIREWLDERGFDSQACVIATLHPEEDGWVCIVLVPDIGVIRVDAVQGTRGDIKTRRAATTIGHWREVNEGQQVMYAGQLEAARRFAAAESST